MQTRRWMVALIVPVIFLSTSNAADRSQPERPKLGVLVFFDQFRGDYLERWDSLYAGDGFRRLMKEGSWYQDCHFPYSTTTTAPGHASVATGANPCRHGIIHNDWFDVENGEAVYCVGSEHYSRVPPRETGSDSKSSAATHRGCSPERLLLPTLGDALKEATKDKAKVVSLGCKDRAAVVLGGKHPDACYWLDDDLFVTSTYYRDKLHSWVEDLNRERVVDQWYGKDWLRLRPDLDYVKYSGPDDVEGEGRGKDLGRTFPHPLGGGLEKPGKAYYKALYASPFANELLMDLVRRAIDGEKLGSHDVPDLLCISFSSNDPVGHIWGPDSQEVLDMTLRSDLIMKDLLACLDKKIGKGKYVLMMAADHGVCPLPEVTRSKGKSAQRVAITTLRKQAEAFLDETFTAKKTDNETEKEPGGSSSGSGNEKEPAVHAVWFEGGLVVDDLIYPSLYLSRKTLKERGLKQDDVERKLSDWLMKQPAVLSVYSHQQLEAGVSKNDEIGRRLMLSFRKDRSGDLSIVPKPYSLIYAVTGTGHGSPHSYDTHVPLLLYGAGVEPGIHKKPIIPQAGTVLFARSLGFSPPAAAEETLAEAYLDAVAK